MTEGEVMVVPDQTKVDIPWLADIAASVGSLFDSHRQQFEALYGYHPNFGDFDSARWLGEIVTDHRDAVLAHVAYLDRALAEITEALNRIPSELAQADAESAATVENLDISPRR